MDASQREKRSKGQWMEERSENLAIQWKATAQEMREQGRQTKTAIAVAIVAKGSLLYKCSADSLLKQVKKGRAGAYLTQLNAPKPARGAVSEQIDQPRSSLTGPLRQSSDQSDVDPSDRARSLNDTYSQERLKNEAMDSMLEDVRINAAIDCLLGSATARSGPERGDHSTGSTH